MCKNAFSSVAFSVLLCLVVAPSNAQSNFTFRKGNNLQVSINKNEADVVHTALDIFSNDYQNVFQAKVTSSSAGDLIVGTIGLNTEAEKSVSSIDLQELKTKSEGFLLIVQNGKLIILGNDKRGTAYGILEVSRIIGVSPWEWWSDSPIAVKDKLTLKNGFRTLQSPSVKHRGIFINDEDWGLTPWSYKNLEPSTIKGNIGPKTHARIFELLLRLRANSYWPAMHECSQAFFMTAGNKEVADKYGIYVGSSHCEPMLCNANAEWKVRGKGDYNYITNRENILKFWEQRTSELSKSDNMYTLGIRGIHDGKMQGANTVQEQKNALTQILKDQREMLSRFVNPDLKKITQVFIPYKEVLDVYNAGLEVPDDVTLMWCDDNYGYITHFPTEAERARPGGNGVYYHISYWGRPHDYLWLGTTSPALIYQQMNLAYDNGIRDIWMLNVGDIKPGEYPLELFMDMAWNINNVKTTGVKSHQLHFLEREFGAEVAAQLNPVMQEFNRLNYIRKPEFMGNTREEEKDPGFKKIKDLPWSETTIRERLSSFQKLADEVEQVASHILPKKKDAYFQLIKYPVQAVAQMNKKLLTAQLARHAKADWKDSDAAFDSIAALTKQYNNAKWNLIMDFQPRKLPVFNRVKRDTASAPFIEDRKPITKWNGADCTKGTPKLFEGLGYEGKAAGINKGTALTYTFDNLKKDSVDIEIRLLPNHPVSGDKLRFTVSLDGNSLQTLSYETKGRSEEWKENVLNNQAIRRVRLALGNSIAHQLTIEALDEGVVIDQLLIY